MCDTLQIASSASNLHKCHAQTRGGKNTRAAVMLVVPSLPDGQAVKLLDNFVVHSTADALSVEQKHGLGNVCHLDTGGQMFTLVLVIVEEHNAKMFLLQVFAIGVAVSVCYKTIALAVVFVRDKAKFFLM